TMSEEHRYKMTTRVLKPMFVGVDIEGMDEFEVTSSQDWWPDAPEGKFSPQTLLVASSGSCFILSFFKAAKSLRVEANNVEVVAEGIMVEDGPVWRFGEMHLDVKVHISADENKDKIERAIDLGHKSCPIANTLKCPTKLHYEIIVE
ncbi:OsmC family peroxiredoxin, partial [Candidatus Thorarchaeota archaeon]